MGTSGLTRDTAGATLNTVVAKSRIRTMPMTNSGRAASERLPMETVMSNFESRRKALNEPNISEIGMLIKAARSTSTAVFRTRRESSSVTALSWTSELPRSPVTTPPSQLTYCITTGSFRPSCSRSAS